MLNENAIVLAGGDSRRMGANKALLRVGENSLVEHIVALLDRIFARVILVTDRPVLFENLPVIITRDIIEEGKKSALRGIHAGLAFSSRRENFVVACDMPFINRGLVEYMSKFAPDFDAVVPKIGPHYQPLYAFYSRELAPLIAERLARGDYKITNFYKDIRVREISPAEVASFDPQMRCFFNINTHRDYLEVREILPGEGEPR